MTVAGPILGTLLVAFTLRELFHTLFHPVGRGGMTAAIFAGVRWPILRLAPARLRLAAPLAMVLVAAAWAAGAAVGFALIYWPFLPDAFIFATSLDPARQTGPLDALYLSLITQSTLGSGEIVPDENALRLAVAAQAVIGFALFTGAVTWVLSIYPALGRQRGTAGLLTAIEEAHEQPGDASLERLAELAPSLVGCRMDLLQYPATFSFAAPDRESSLAVALPWLEQALTDGVPGNEEAAQAAREVRVAHDRLVTTIGRRLGCEDRPNGEILDAYRAFHRV